MKYEIGPGGTGIKLNSVQAEVLQSLNAEPYAKSFDLGGIRSAYSVHARGSMLGACSIFSWKKQLTVLQVGRRYRIFLDGSKEENSFYYQSWFAGVEKIGDLRSGPLESGETGAGSSGSILTQPVQYGGSGGEKSDLNIPVGCPCGGGP
jgi:hypothetical protein